MCTKFLNISNFHSAIHSNYVFYLVDNIVLSLCESICFPLEPGDEEEGPRRKRKRAEKAAMGDIEEEEVINNTVQCDFG